MNRRLFRAVAALGVAALAVGTIGPAVAQRKAALDGTAANRPLRILVTNDDGVAAPGIDALVEAVRTLPNVEVTVVAPATNQSGVGDRVSTTPLVITNATTASGYPATAVGGTPADSILYALKTLLPERPDLILSGINQGQNLSAELVAISGTVGAALWGARNHIPAIAASQGLATTMGYTASAQFVAFSVALFRQSLLEFPVDGNAKVLSMNFPTCPTGSTRGFVLVPTGRANTVTGYTGTGTVTPVIVSRNVFVTDCTSTVTDFPDDVAAFINGYATLSPLNPDLNSLPPAG